jgi:hypothetical protein
VRLFVSDDSDSAPRPKGGEGGQDVEEHADASMAPALLEPEPTSLNADPVFGPRSVRSVSHMREWARQWLAIIIVSCLLAIVVLSFLLIFIMEFRGEISISEAKDFVSLIIGPVVGIVGAVTGFYFGNIRNGDNDDT